MAFFNRKKSTAGSAGPAPKLPKNVPQLRTGMKTVVLTLDNHPIFAGHLKVLDGGILEIRSMTGKISYEAEHGLEVRMKVTQPDGSEAILRGLIAEITPDAWQIERPRFLQSYEKRNFFRQRIVVDTFLYPSSASGMSVPCRILDISGGGARILAEWQFHKGSTFRLETSLVPSEPPFSLPCTVKRVKSLSRPGSPFQRAEYGCEFIDLPENEQDRLLQVVFLIQQKTAKNAKT